MSKFLICMEMHGATGARRAITRNSSWLIGLHRAMLMRRSCAGP